MAKKSNAWRPTIMTEQVVNKLLFAFAHSFTDAEACLYADISKPSLYKYIETHPEFSDQKEALKKTPNIKAKLNWIKKIEEWEYNASKEWLERKAKDEFSLKQEVDNTNTNMDVTDSLEEKQRREIANRYLKTNG
jgi:hypothetical protein